EGSTSDANVSVAPADFLDVAYVLLSVFLLVLKTATPEGNPAHISSVSSGRAIRFNVYHRASNQLGGVRSEGGSALLGEGFEGAGESFHHVALEVLSGDSRLVFRRYRNVPDIGREEVYGIRHSPLIPVSVRRIQLIQFLPFQMVITEQKIHNIALHFRF